MNNQDVHVSKLKKVKVTLAPPEQQKRIVAEIETRTIAIDRLEAELDKHFKDAIRLRQSVLASAFSGTLKVEIGDL